MSHPPPNPVPSKPPVGLYGGNVLFQAPSRWDDAFFSVPAVRAIRASRPSCILGVICHEDQMPLWQNVPGINELIPWNKKTRTSAITSRYDWESAIIWENNIAADYCKATRIKQRLGYPAKEIRKFLTDEITIHVPNGPVEHRVRHYLRLMEKFHIQTQRADIFSPCKLDVETPNKNFLISPDSDYGSHYEWSLDHWMTLCHHLLHKGAELTLLQVHNDEKKSLAAQLGKKLHLPEYLYWQPLNSTLPIIAAHQYSVCADSSLIHLSAFLGLTTFSLFGPGNPDYRRPLGRQHLSIRNKAECSPCMLAKCPLDLRCQNELTPDFVANKIFQHIATQTL